MEQQIQFVIDTQTAEYIGDTANRIEHILTGVAPAIARGAYGVPAVQYMKGMSRLTQQTVKEVHDIVTREGAGRVEAALILVSCGMIGLEALNDMGKPMPSAVVNLLQKMEEARHA